MSVCVGAVPLCSVVARHVRVPPPLCRVQAYGIGVIMAGGGFNLQVGAWGRACEGREARAYVRVRLTRSSGSQSFLTSTVLLSFATFGWMVAGAGALSIARTFAGARTSAARRSCSVPEHSLITNQFPRATVWLAAFLWAFRLTSLGVTLIMVAPMVSTPTNVYVRAQRVCVCVLCLCVSVCV